MAQESAEIDELLARARDGDARSIERLFSSHTDRLRRMVRMRLDRRLWSRMDVDDVIQDVYAEATRRLQEFLDTPDVPFLVRLRGLTKQRISNLHRDHLEAQVRDVRREVRLGARARHVTSEAIADQLLRGDGTTPSRKAMYAEAREILLEALDAMDERDREVLSLRHFEHLSNAEVAAELGIGESAASKRYLRGLARLRAVLEELPGGVDGDLAP